MNSLVDSLTGTTASGHAMDPLPSGSPLSTPISVSVLSVTTDMGSSSNPVVLPAPPPSSSSVNDQDGPIAISTDGNGFIYTTAPYSTQNPSSSTIPFASNPNPPDTNNTGIIIAGVAGGVGSLLLLVGVTWFVWVRRAKRHARNSLIKDRMFYPDRYNQTMTSRRHGTFNEIQPGPVIVQPPPPHPPPPLPLQTSCLPPDPLSRRTLSYHNRAPSLWQTREDRVGPFPTDGVLGPDVPPLTRHRFPYPSTPPQPLQDRYTMLPEPRPASSVNPSTAPLRLAPNPHRPHHYRSSSSTHHSRHSHHSHHNRPCRQQSHDERDSYFPQVSIPIPPPIPTRITRRNTIFVSPPTSPSSFPVLSNPPEPTTVTLRSQPSIAHSTFSSIDSLVLMNGAKRMTCTNPDSDVDLETDTDPDRSSVSGGGGGGSPSVTDIIRFYDRDRDQDTSD